MYRVAIDRAEPLRHLDTEWLLTNGLGGFAMGTVLSTNTRRYHGLLVASMIPPLGRVVALHTVIEQLETPDGPIDLALPQFELRSKDSRLQTTLLRFEFDPPARALWVYRVGQIVIEKELMLRPWGNIAELSYMVRHAPAAVTLRLRPLVALRDFHSLSHEDDGEPEVQPVGRGVFTLRRRESRLTLEGFGGSSMERIHQPEWWRNLTYEEDARRGQEFREDVFCPGVYEARITRGRGEVVILKATAENAQHAWPDLPTRTILLPPPARVAPSATERLRIAADQFITSRLDGDTWRTTVLAGFPWFADWGRDTMISLPGLLIATGRLQDAKSALTLFARHIKSGLVPNRFDDYGGPPEYNTVDASLWFVHAVHELWKADALLVDDVLRFACWNILAAYRHGTDFDIRMDDDGLIAAGNAETQITWMDARRDGIVFTPRNGKPVEIQALWHHALRCAVELLAGAPECAEYEVLAERAAESIRTKFWWPERECLHDVLMPSGTPTLRVGSDQGSPALRAGSQAPHGSESRGTPDWRPDGRLRPNQLLAVSLEPSPLSREQQRGVVESARQHLLTPYGLRTLSRDHRDYIGRFEGDMRRRDQAYHNGTVWPWLIGPYCEALLRSEDFSDAAREEVRSALAPLLASLHSGCLGQIAEVYDGDPPHRESGCPAQAWSVAELLRVLMMLQAV